MTDRKIERKPPPERRAPKSHSVEATGGQTRAEALTAALESRHDAATGAPVDMVEKAKPKLIRDSFTIPKSEYLVLEELKTRAADLKRPTKKSELLRAGIAALSAMRDEDFLGVLSAVVSLKTGRPKAMPDKPGTSGLPVPKPRRSTKTAGAASAAAADAPRRRGRS